MKRIPEALRGIIAENIRYCRERRFPGKGGGKQCALAFGVSQQQWSPWERGSRTPDEGNLEKIACFFGTSVEWLREHHRFSDHSTGENDAFLLASNANSDAMDAFFRRLERALSHPNTGEIRIDVTLRCRGNGKQPQWK